MGKVSVWTSRGANGCYNCRCKADGEVQEPTSLCEKVWWWFLLVVFGFILTWLYCWGVFGNDDDNFNFFVYENTGFWFAWAALILIFSCFLFIYMFLVLAMGICIIAKGQGRHMHVCHKVFLFVALIVCISAYIAIDMLWNYEYRTAVISLQMIGPFIHIVGLFIITASSWLMLSEIMNIKSFRMWLAAVIGICCLMLFACLIPLAIDSPCLGDDVKARSKPLLIGHRLGYVKTVPENTRMAYEQASTCDLYGVETDISISTDGVPFVMHDTENMLRTTNVADVFPNRSKLMPEWFSWSEVQQLDAGSWFLEEDPYLTVHTLSKEVKNEIRKQKVLSLDEVARMIGTHSIIFDLRQPPPGHPYRENFTELTMHVLLNSGLPQEQVLWLPSKNRNDIRASAPGFQQVSAETSIEYLVSADIRTTNLEYNYQGKQRIMLYYQNNISTIQYVISSPWLFSAVWCQGATYVTTGDCKETSPLAAPIWTLTVGEYAAVWICCDLVALAIFVAFFIILHKRSIVQSARIRDDETGYINMTS